VLFVKFAYFVCNFNLEYGFNCYRAVFVVLATRRTLCFLVDLWLTTHLAFLNNMDFHRFIRRFKGEIMIDFICTTHVKARNGITSESFLWVMVKKIVSKFVCSVETCFIFSRFSIFRWFYIAKNFFVSFVELGNVFCFLFLLSRFLFVLYLLFTSLLNFLSFCIVVFT